MKGGDHTFSELLTRARGGDQEATNELLAKYKREILVMVRARLPRMIRRQYDSEDFVQAVLKSVLPKLQRESAGLEDERRLRDYLEGMVRNKVGQQYRRLTRVAKYDVAREQGLYIRRGDQEAPLEIVSSDPSPSSVAQAGECFERLTSGLPPVEVEVLRLLSQGMSYAAVAERTKIGERSLRRIVAAVRSRWERRP